MVNRRDIASLVGLGAVATMAAAAPAAAQSAGKESAFDRIRRTKKLRTAVIAGGAPYYQKDITTGEWRGFYIDMVKDLAKEMEAEPEFIESTWGNTILDLQSDKIDLFFGVNPTPKRALVIDFSQPVFSNAFAVIAKKGHAPKTWEEMNTPDTKISVDAGSSQDAVVSRMCPKAQISRLKTADDATAALQAGRVDAQSLILMLSLTVKKKNPAIGDVIVPTPVFGTTSNVGFRREEDKTLRDFVNIWIDINKGTGYIRDTIVRNMELVGVKESDFPPGVSL
ncbi:MAG TPA: transporter substrate-binding domain-containing protein [Rhizobium sp.]